MAASPHDALFKACFGRPELARSELELVLPAEVSAHLDLGTLVVLPGSFVDEELQQTHSDVLYGVRTRAGTQGLVYVLLEHQSSPDGAMPFRLLRYIVRVWEQWLRNHPGATRLPLVLPIVLHHGDAPWRAAPELVSMLDASPELIEATRRFVPHFQFALDDLALMTPEMLSSRALDPLPRLVQLALWASRSFPRLNHAMPFMRAIAATLAWDERTRALLHQLFVYVLSTAPAEVEEEVIRSMLLEVAGPRGHEDVVNAAEQLIERGRAEGRAEAVAELRSRIYAELSARGVALSAPARTRVTTCSDVAVLTRWLARAVTAESEAEIFAEGSSP